MTNTTLVLNRLDTTTIAMQGYGGGGGGWRLTCMPYPVPVRPLLPRPTPATAFDCRQPLLGRVAAPPLLLVCVGREGGRAPLVALPSAPFQWHPYSMPPGKRQHAL